MPNDEQRRIALDSTDLDIVASDPHVYDVTITHKSGAETRHCVTVPEELLAELGVSAAQEPLLVRASLIYLMEQVPTAVPEQFGLDEIGRAVPAYREDILTRI
jgi:hypothetical protein